jgi:hypothetical protein
MFELKGVCQSDASDTRQQTKRIYPHTNSLGPPNRTLRGCWYVDKCAGAEGKEISDYRGLARFPLRTAAVGSARKFASCYDVQGERFSRR